MKRLMFGFLAGALLFGSAVLANDFYNHSGAPATGGPGSSAQMRAEFGSIGTGFDKFPALAGNGNKALVINAGGTAVGLSTGTLSLGGNFATSGAFATTLTATNTTTLTLPTTGTLATLAGAESFSNKTIVAPVFSGSATGSLTSLALTTPVLTGSVTGTYTLAGTPTIASPVFSGTATGTYTLAGTPTITAPTISSPVLSGTATGTYTLAGTPTLTSPTINTGTVGAAPITVLGVANKQYVDERFENLTLAASVAGNALTIAVKTNVGTDASSADPIVLPFRHSTLGNGTYETVTMTAALSLTVSSGSTVGTSSGVAHRIYIGVANDVGTLRLFVYNPLVSSPLSLLGVMDNGPLYSSTAEGGAGASDNAQILYSGTAFTTKAVRVIGYVESTQATAGTWVTAPSRIHVLRTGDNRTGDTVQVQVTITGAVSTGTTPVPFDDTIPQSTEGDQFMTQAITPTSLVNLLRVSHLGHYSNSSSADIAAALFQDSAVNALSVGWNTVPNTGYAHTPSLEYLMIAGTSSVTTFKIRAGAGSGTTTFNGAGGARKYGGVLSSRLAVEEIFV